MLVKFKLTPSCKIEGLPDPVPKAGETAEINDDLAESFIARGIAVAVAQPKKRKPREKLTGVAVKPSIAETTTPIIKDSE